MRDLSKKLTAAERLAKTPARAPPVPGQPKQDRKRGPSGFDVWKKAMQAGGEHKLTPSQTLVYGRMRWRGNPYFEAADTVAHVLGLSVDTVRRARAALCDKGLARLTGTKDCETRTRGTQTVNCYEVL